MSTSRPRHTNRDYETLLQKAEGHGWRVTKNKRHFRAYCPWDCMCIVTVSATPSAQGALKKVRADINRCRKAGDNPNDHNNAG